MSLPKSYWTQALLMACFFINRMPLSTLNNHIPFLVLNPTKTMYPLKPKVFGCSCFVHIFGGCKDKLSSQSVKGIFLSYSKTQKGYFCYNPTTKKWFVSIDVIIGSVDGSLTDLLEGKKVVGC